MRTKHLAALGLIAASTTLTGAAGAPGRSAGAISGTVTFTGTPPKMRPIDMAKEPSCAAQHPTPVMTESAVTGPGNTVQWAVVYISAGDQPAPAPATPVRYDQKGCEYIPHVAALQVAQPLEIYNDDQTSHNIHPLAKVNPEWNKSQPPGSPTIKATYEKPEFIAVKCNVHPWMHGYFVVLGHLELRRDRERRHVQPEGAAAGEIHRDRVARAVRDPESGGHPVRNGVGDRQLRPQGDALLSRGALCHRSHRRRASWENCSPAL